MAIQMAFHNEAKPGEIAKTVLMPGDPLRAKAIAEQYLSNARCVNTIRGMLGYTGYFQGKPVSVMGSGMGVPSMGIYCHELYEFYDVDAIIRIGSCGAYTPLLDLRDIVLAESSFYEGAFALQLTGKKAHWALPDRKLNAHIKRTARALGIALVEGPIASTEAFDPYLEDPFSIMKRYQQRGPETAEILGSEMESFGLFTVAHHLNTKHPGWNKKAACLLTVADSTFKDSALTPKERQKNLNTMTEVALNAAISI